MKNVLDSKNATFKLLSEFFLYVATHCEQLKMIKKRFMVAFLFFFLNRLELQENLHKVIKTT